MSYFEQYGEGDKERERSRTSPMKLSRFRRRSTKGAADRDAPKSALPTSSKSTGSGDGHAAHQTGSKQLSINTTISRLTPILADKAAAPQSPSSLFAFSEPTSPIALAHVSDVSTETMDQLVDTLRSSKNGASGASSRRGRSRKRDDLPRARRRSGDKLEQHHRELRSRLETLAADPPSSPKPPSLHTPADSDFDSPLNPLSRRSSGYPDELTFASSFVGRGDSFAALDAVIDYSERCMPAPSTPPTVRPALVPLPLPTPPQPAAKIKSIEEIIGAFQPKAVSPPTVRLVKSDSAKSIEDIVAEHAPKVKAASRRTSGNKASTQAMLGILGVQEEEEDVGKRSSTDSLDDELRQSLLMPAAPLLHHTKSLPDIKGRRKLSASIRSEPAVPLPTPSRSVSGSFTSPPSLAATTPRTERQIAAYLRSPRLTRLMLLRRAPNTGITVSLADVGSATGRPVIVFLGLGCVRYLVALYDELAEAYGLRLICLDRWGLGRTSDVPDSKRGFIEWSSIIEEVADELGLAQFSVLAHSAGAPYALASTLRLPERIRGSVHLLAPWVATGESADAAAAFKWLRWVPSPVIKGAQAAEWRVQAWKLGKPPTLTPEGVGYDPRAPISSATAGAVLCESPLLSAEDEGWDASSRMSYEASDRGTITPRTETGTPKTRFQQLFGRKSSASLKSPSLGSSTPDRALSPTPSMKSRESLPFSALAPSLLRSRGSSTSSAPIEPVSHAVDLGTALLAASHAESLKGGTADLMAILERTSKPMGFTYASVTRHVKIWHGERDERIPLAGVRGVERSMPSAELKVVEGATHDLMSNVQVVCEALESLRSEW